MLMMCSVSRTCVGTLCGHCKDGKGVSILFNRCVDCSNGFVALIVALSKHLITIKYLAIAALSLYISVIADVIIITVILLKQITLPAWLFPAIFNIQV